MRPISTFFCAFMLFTAIAPSAHSLDFELGRRSSTSAKKVRPTVIVFAENLSEVDRADETAQRLRPVFQNAKGTIKTLLTNVASNMGVWATTIHNLKADKLLEVSKRETGKTPSKKSRLFKRTRKKVDHALPIAFMLVRRAHESTMKAAEEEYASLIYKVLGQSHKSLDAVIASLKVEVADGVSVASLTSTKKLKTT